MRMGLFTALAIAIHNFPEGLVTFVSTLQNPIIAIPIVVAIAIHNIPEGITVSVPIYQSTGSKSKAFWYSFLSGLAEPVGALAGWLILMPIMNNVVFGIIYAVVAGIMVSVSIMPSTCAVSLIGSREAKILNEKNTNISMTGNSMAPVRPI